MERVEKAYAKINLGLKVLGRRADGYHELRSVVQCIDLADVLHFCPAAENRLSCTDPLLPSGAENLALRALELFNRRRTGAPRTFHLHLEKHIPIAAGLGGGSADAAAVLRFLNRCCGEPFSAAQLRALGAELGSDIPFLIEGGTALIRGRGECVEPLQWATDAVYVLVYPGVELSTAWAYARLGAGASDLTASSPYLKFVNSLESGGRVEGEALFSVLENDFQPLVERAKPIVAALSSRLRAAGARVCSMSGTGSTLYGIFDDRTVAQQAQRAMQAKGYWSFLCRPCERLV